MKISKGLVLLSLFLVGGIGFYAQAVDCTSNNSQNDSTCQPRNLAVDPNHAVQQIPKIVFAVPNADGSRGIPTQVTVEGTVDTVKVYGALLTNTNKANTITNPTGTNFSIL